MRPQLAPQHSSVGCRNIVAAPAGRDIPCGSTSAQENPVEERLTRFIPSVQLLGTRADKLRTLDTLIAHLEQLRHRLAGDPFPSAIYDSRTPLATSPSWSWFSAGIALAGVVVLLFALAARGCVGES